jgi:hypothetical protein
MIRRVEHSLVRNLQCRLGNIFVILERKAKCRLHRTISWESLVHGRDKKITSGFNMNYQYIHVGSTEEDEILPFFSWISEYSMYLCTVYSTL